MRRPSGLLTQGVAIGYLSVIVLLPLAALTWKAGQGGWSSFWDAITAPDRRGTGKRGRATGAPGFPQAGRGGKWLVV